MKGAHMSEPVEPMGWQVLDPDGNVIDSGPLTVMYMAADLGENPQPEDVDGSN